MQSQQELIHTLKDKTFKLALKIIYIHKDIVMNYQESFLSEKLLTNGTTIGEYVVDATGTSYTSDFNYYVLKIQQTLERTKYWLGLLHESTFVSSESYDALMHEMEAINRLILTCQKEKVV